MATGNEFIDDPRVREAALTIPVYGQLPFVPERASGCDIFTRDGRRILDLYGGHAVAALGYGHPRLVQAIQEQSSKLLFQSNAVALDVRADAAEQLSRITPANITRVFFVNSGAEANENALRMALMATGRKKVLAITHGFHGRTAAAAAVTWNADKWYGFPAKPFDVAFIPRDDIAAAQSMIDDSVAVCVRQVPMCDDQGQIDGEGRSGNGSAARFRFERSQHGAVCRAIPIANGRRWNLNCHLHTMYFASIVAPRMSHLAFVAGLLPALSTTEMVEVCSRALIGPKAVSADVSGRRSRHRHLNHPHVAIQHSGEVLFRVLPVGDGR